MVEFLIDNSSLDELFIEDLSKDEFVWDLLSMVELLVDKLSLFFDPWPFLGPFLSRVELMVGNFSKDEPLFQDLSKDE